MVDRKSIDALIGRIAATAIWQDTYPDGPDMMDGRYSVTPDDVRACRSALGASLAGTLRKDVSEKRKDFSGAREQIVAEAAGSVQVTDAMVEAAMAVPPINNRGPHVFDANRMHTALTAALDADARLCPICAAPFKPDDLCATDIELGICHAACLEGSPTVDLETGEPTDGPISPYVYDPDVPVWLLDLMSRWPLGTRIEIDHDGFRGPIVGYYRRHDGKCGAVLQIEGGRIIHVYGEQWLKRAEGPSNV